MKRTATTMMLLAGFGGGCVSPDGPTANKPVMQGGYGTVTRPKTVPGVQGPGGEPVAMTAVRGATPGGQPGMPPAAWAATGVQPAGGLAAAGGGVVRAHLPGGYMTKADPGVVPVNGFGAMGGGAPTNAGILPVPGMGPPGAVAAVGAIVPGMRPAITNQRTSVRFTGPAGMKITWQLPGGGFNDEATGLTAPKEYNFLQSQVYRLRLTQVLPNFPGRTFYPTLEVAPVTPKTLTFLAHASVPVTFTDEDFRQAADGNLVVKVIYLPDPTFQDFATVAGAEEIVSTRLEPGADPVAEAQRRGTILAIIRLGNIDLENRASPTMTAPPPGVMIPPGAVMLPPGAVPPGVVPVPVPGPGANVPSPGVPFTTASPPLARPVAPGGPIAPGPLPPALGGKDGAPKSISVPVPPGK
jgi:hypothetical protein